ncbi:MAG: M23 family metallopeptidase [Bacteroidales bacterium]|nr:M23 family metallopeptidase [Bacteroidales bacterium]
MKIGYVLTIAMCMCFAHSSFAQLINDNTLIPDTTYIGPTNDQEFEEETNIIATNLNSYYIPSTIDTLTHVPAYNLYLFWDTTDIHPYQSKMVLFKDKHNIPLRNNETKFFFPYKNNEITSDFGWRRWKYHYGIDLRVNVGDSILSCFDGMVRIAQKSRSYGYTVVIRHNNGLETLYAHLSKLLVKPNQSIKAGEVVGLAGNTGRSTGPHLHFEIRYLGGPINPHDIINFNSMDLHSDTLTISQQTFAYLEDVFKARYHTVRKGDTLGKIAKKYGVSINRLCKLNGISRKKILRPGQKIRYT